MIIFLTTMFLLPLGLVGPLPLSVRRVHKDELDIVSSMMAALAERGPSKAAWRAGLH